MVRAMTDPIPVRANMSVRVRFRHAFLAIIVRGTQTIINTINMITMVPDAMGSYRRGY